MIQKPTTLPFDLGSRAIREVEPLLIDPRISQGNWACTRCQAQHPVERTFAVHFDSKGRTLLFVVCPACAELFRVPGPVDLDLRRLPPADRADRSLRTVTAHAWFVSNVRSRPPGTVLRLRDADVRELAHDNRETPTTLVRRLADQGLLATA